MTSSFQWFNGLLVAKEGDSGLKNWFNGLPAQIVSSSSGSSLTAGLVTDADSFYSPTATPAAVTLTPTWVVDPETIHQPTVTPAVTLTPSLVSDTDFFYQPALSAASTILPLSAYSDADTIYQPTTDPGEVSLAPSLVTSADVVYSPNEAPGEVDAAPDLVSDADAFYQPTTTASDDALPSLYSDADSFYQPTAVNAAGLVASLHVDSDVVHHTSVLSVNSLLPSFSVSDAIIYVPVDASIYFLLDALHVDADSFYEPTLEGGAISVEPSRYVDTDAVYVPAVQRQSTQGGGGGGNNALPANVKYATPVTVGSSGLISALQIQANTAYPLAQTRMMIYADAGGLPDAGALLAASTTKTGLVVGTNTYPLTVPYAALAGTKLWITIHTNANINVLGNTKSGARYDADLFSDGPSDPFGASSLDNKKAPVLLVILGSANASVLPTLHSDADTFYSPTVRSSHSLLPSALQDEDFFYQALALGVNSAQPIEYDDVSTFYQPVVSVGSVTLSPPFVQDDESAIIPVIGVGDASVKFPARLDDPDAFYQPTATTEGASLPPGLVDSDDAFYAAAVASRYVLAPSLVPQDDATADAEGSPGSVGVSPAHWLDVDQHWLSGLANAGGTHAISPPLMDPDDVVYASGGAVPRRSHRVSLRGTRQAAPVLSGAVPDVQLTGDAAHANIELEGNDA